MRPAKDLQRELEKVGDALDWAVTHFKAEGEMNAALHMNSTVRPTPLAAAIESASADIERLVMELAGEPEDG